MDMEGRDRCPSDPGPGARAVGGMEEQRGAPQDRRAVIEDWAMRSLPSNHAIQFGLEIFLSVTASFLDQSQQRARARKG